MHMELRSLNGIRRFTYALREGEYDDNNENEDRSVVHLYITLHRKRFIDLDDPEGDYEDALMDLTAAAQQELSLFSLAFGTIGHDDLNDCPLPVKAVTKAIDHADGLRMLRIRDVCLIGKERDYEELAQALKQLPKLSSLVFECHCKLLEASQTSETSPLDIVLRQLKDHSSLNELEIVKGQYCGRLQASTLAGLSELRLEKLKLITTPPCTDGMARMARQLTKPNNQLRVLSLGFHPLTAKGCKHLGVILSGAHSKVEKLHLNVRSINEDAQRIFKSLAMALSGANCTELRLDIPTEHFSVGLEYFKSILCGSNFYLEKVELFKFNGLPNDKDKELMLYLSCSAAEEDDEVAFFLKVNRLGRKTLFEGNPNPQMETWRKVLTTAEGDVDRIFQLIQGNPLTICRTLGMNSRDDTEQEKGEDQSAESDEGTKAETEVATSENETIGAVLDSVRKHSAVVKAIRDTSTGNIHGGEPTIASHHSAVLNFSLGFAACASLAFFGLVPGG